MSITPSLSKTERAGAPYGYEWALVPIGFVEKADLAFKAASDWRSSKGDLAAASEWEAWRQKLRALREQTP